MKFPAVDFDTAKTAADALISEIAPACDRIAAVGQLRRESPVVTEIRLLAIPKNDVPIGEKLQRVHLQHVANSVVCEKADFAVSVPVKIITTTGAAWPAMLFHHTASKNLHIAVQTVSKAMHRLWKPEEGVFKCAKCEREPVRIHNENEVFEFTHIPYLPPEQREGGPLFSLRSSRRVLPMELNETRKLIAESQWVETKCGGEWHEYTLRVLSPCEVSFVHLVETIRTHGYNGVYGGKAYRYLDVDGMQYFTQGYDMRVTFLINRKKLPGPDRPWKKNPRKFRELPDRFGRLD